jgi:hypothetical protein
MYKDLEKSLFDKRFHGATNINGIDFQIHYALNASMGLLLPETHLDQVILEGIEDIDLKTFKSGNTFVQVKTSKNPWHLNNLSDVLVNFVEQNKVTNTSNRFELVVNFPLKVSASNLFSNEITESDRSEIILKVLKFKPIKSKQITYEQILRVVTHTTVKSITKIEIVNDTKSKLHKNLNIYPDEIDHALLSLLYKFIDWSIERKTVTKLDLINFTTNYEENKARSIEFESYGKGLISRLDWQKDQRVDDYYEGKKTRFSHIFSGLDIKRDRWLNKISEVFGKINVCIIREASGQGKSSLAFRYIYEHWSAEHTFAIKVVENAADAEAISNYLISLAGLGLPIKVLIDDLDQEKRYFQLVLQNCSNSPIDFLITSRNDDYHHCVTSSTVSLEFIVPHFDRSEASLIFQNLKKANRVSSNIKSSDYAYERINSPKCLIEFIFLITQGEMIHERLSSQVKEMRNRDQTPKISLLRNAMTAIICQAPLSIDKIIIDNDSTIDYQEILRSINGEFVTIENGYIQGYHWVRTAHLLKILNDNYANPAITALQIIPLIDRDKLSTFIGNLTYLPEFNLDTLIQNFGQFAFKEDVQLYMSFVEGIFIIGEKFFFKTNMAIYDEGYREFNEGVLFLFNAKFLPTGGHDLLGIFGQDSNFEKVRKLSDKFITNERGLDFAKKFVLTNKTKFDIHNDSIKFLGKVLDWSHWLKNDFWNEVEISKIINKNDLIDLDINSFSLTSQSLHRTFPSIHSEWFSKNKSKILDKIQVDVKCDIKLRKKTVAITYSELIEGESLSSLTYNKLKMIRSAIPFCEIYKGKYEANSWIERIANLQNSYDESFKEIPVENFHFESDIEKNKVLSDIVESHYRVKTWYEFSEYYYFLRKGLIQYCECLSKRFDGKSADFGKCDAPYISEKILHSYKMLPVNIQDLEKSFSICRNTFNSFNNFLIAKSRLVDNYKDKESKRLLFINYNNFLLELSEMQNFFNQIKPFSPDYFNFAVLDEKENQVFKRLKALLRMNIINSKAYWEINTLL